MKDKPTFLRINAQRMVNVEDVRAVNVIDKETLELRDARDLPLGRIPTAEFYKAVRVLGDSP